MLDGIEELTLQVSYLIPFNPLPFTGFYMITASVMKGLRVVSKVFKWLNRLMYLALML